ncbi:MAG: nucleotidyltransferase domain-containing protein [bacterium]|nr:nucleotidyltransferase domain-containing protein [bacterium]
MRLEHYSAIKLKKEITTLVGRYLDLKNGGYKIFFFGSRVTGKGDEKSDIDVGIEGKDKIAAKTMSKMKEEIENLSILYKIELVDFRKVSSDFKKVALKKIERII